MPAASPSVCVGELQVPSANKPAFQVFPLKHLIIYVLPFAKGAPTAPELKVDVAASLKEERAAVLALLGANRYRPSRGRGPAHPLFLPLKYVLSGSV